MKLAEVREAAGLSQAKLAAKAQIHPSTVSAIESGRLQPYPKQMVKLAKALDWKGELEELFAPTR